MQLSVLIFLFFLRSLASKYILTWNNEPYSSCLSETSFSGLDIEYSSSLMKKLGLGQDWQFLCIDPSNPPPDQSEVLFWIGGISEASIDYFLSMNLRPSIPITNSGLSIVLYQKREPWLFFKQFSWETIILVILFPIAIGLLSFMFEEKKFALEDYLWAAFSALFLMNNLKLMRSSSRIMLFGLWIMGFVIWTFCFCGVFEKFYQQNALYKVRSIYDIKNKEVFTRRAFFNEIRIYGGKPKTFTLAENITLSFSVEYFKNLLGDGGNEILVIDDALGGFLETLDKDFWRVDAKFRPLNFYLVFPQNTSESFENQVNQAIQALWVEKTRYETIDPSLFSRYYWKSTIQMNFIDEFLILLGIFLAICVFIKMMSRLVFRRIKLYHYFVENRLINISAGLKKKQRIFIKKTPTVFSLEMLKSIIDSHVMKINTELKMRLEIMSDKIGRFYDMLLTPQKEKNPDGLSLKDQIDDKMNRKPKKNFTVPSILRQPKKIGFEQREKSKKKTTWN